MASIASRLAKLEAAYDPMRSVVAPQIDHLRKWSRPLMPAAFYQYALGIASDRAAVTPPKSGDDFQAMLWIVWDEERARILDAGRLPDDLRVRFLNACDIAELHRGDPAFPLFREVWPEWRPDMDEVDQIAFDIMLRNDGARCEAAVRDGEWR